MVSKLIDTHSHIYDTAFDNDRAQAVNRSLSAGVGTIILPAIDSESHDALFSLCDNFPDVCLPLMGLHPTSVNDNPDYKLELEKVFEYVNSGTRNFYGVGEIGLDYYWSKDFMTRQQDVFRSQLDLALSKDLPAIIHTRDAWQDMTAIISGYRGKGLRGVMHSFSGSMRDYETIIEAGDFYFGIGGVVSYKNSGIAELLPSMDLTRIVLETDSPYLTPVPFRGKRNESAYLVYICNKVAEIYGLPPAQIAEITTCNARKLFGL